MSLLDSPADVSALIDLARGLRAHGRHEEAARHFDHAAALRPHDADVQLLARLHRGTWLDERGRADEALACFEEAVQHHPGSADAWAALGMLQYALQGPQAAEASFQRALQIDATRHDVIEKYALVLQAQRRHADASLAFQRLLQLRPQHPLAAGRLLHSKMLNADWTAYEPVRQRVQAAVAAGQHVAEPFGLQAHCSSPALLMQAARLHSATLYPDRSSLLPPARIGRGERLRIGYVSGELGSHATSVLLAGVLAHHDRARFEVFAFDNGVDDGSELRQRIASAVHEIVPIRTLPHLPAAHAVRERSIDILVDLNGHFGRARPQLFALRPAPLQVNFLGFPGTLGTPCCDYLIADGTVIPRSDQRHYVEQVVTLPHSYQPNDDRRRIADEPRTRAEAGLPDGAFVFCCLNNVYKITPALFDIWMRLLKRVPDSVLLLYSDAPETQENLRVEAESRGVAPQRLLFAAPLGHAQHLARLRLADLFLDTLPYNAHTTASDALWAGLPLLTCTGTTFPGRVATSLLHAVGLPELATSTLEDYESLALRLATEPSQLAAQRARLAAQLPKAPLFDTARYTRHLEAAYLQMAARARAGLAPVPFDVPAGS